MAEREEIGYTVEQPLRVRLTVKGSRFIASLAPANTEKLVLEFINSIRDEYPDATHHTYAYRLGMGEDRIERLSDAREPAGTAGPPILQELERAKVTNAVLQGSGLGNVSVVVTRYFGGIKLGVGGLARAYRSCARSCLEEAQLIALRQLADLTAVLIYDDLGPSLRYIESLKGEIIKIDYGEQIRVSFSVPAAFKGEIIRGLREISRGRVKIKSP